MFLALMLLQQQMMLFITDLKEDLQTVLQEVQSSIFFLNFPIKLKTVSHFLS